MINSLPLSFRDIVIYSDGGSRPNPGRGAVCSIITVDGRDKLMIVGSDDNTTNNRMELMGALKGLDLVHSLIKNTMLVPDHSLNNPCLCNGDKHATFESILEPTYNRLTTESFDKLSIKVSTDSQYVVNSFTKWARNWATRAFHGVKNPDLVKDIYRKSEALLVNWEWVRGHSGHYHNERCDKICTDTILNKVPNSVYTYYMDRLKISLIPDQIGKCRIISRPVQTPGIDSMTRKPLFNQVYDLSNEIIAKMQRANSDVIYVDAFIRHIECPILPMGKLDVVTLDNIKIQETVVGGIDESEWSY